jgi:GAF domain-containing protein
MSPSDDNPQEGSVLEEIKYQSAVAILCQRALEETDVGALLAEAVVLVPTVLEMQFCEILELLPDRKHFFRRATYGWKETAATLSLVPSDITSLAGHALMSDEPVILENLTTESKLVASPELYEHNVASGVSIKIHRRGSTYGVLGVFTSTERGFSRSCIYFLETITNVLAIAIQGLAAQKALRESHERLQMAADAQDQVIWDWDLITDQIGWSPSVDRVFGYSPEETGSTSRLKYLRIHPADRDRVIASVHAVIEEGGEKWKDEYRFLRADESYAMIRDYGIVLYNDSGRAVRMVGTMLEL